MCLPPAVSDRKGKNHRRLLSSLHPFYLPPLSPPKSRRPPRLEHTQERREENPPPLFLSIGLQRGESLYRKARLEEERGQICFIAPPEEEEDGVGGG